MDKSGRVVYNHEQYAESKNEDNQIWSVWKKNCLISIGSFFYGISTFVVYLMPKPSWQKNGCDAIQSIAGVDMEFMPFPSEEVRKWT